MCAQQLALVRGQLIANLAGRAVVVMVVMRSPAVALGYLVGWVPVLRATMN